MKPVLALTLLVSSLVCGMSVSAQRPVFKSGKDLHEALQQDGAEYSYALNYIVGVVDASNGSPAGTASVSTWVLRGSTRPRSPKW